jgi:hypothetical protein
VYIYIRCTGGGAYCEFNTGCTASGEPKRSGAPCGIGKKKLKKMPNFKLNSNFNWMKMQIGR